MASDLPDDTIYVVQAETVDTRHDSQAVDQKLELYS